MAPVRWGSQPGNIIFNSVNYRMPPTPFFDSQEGGFQALGTDGDAVFKSGSDGSTTVGGVTPLSTNTSTGVVRIDTAFGVPHGPFGVPHGPFGVISSDSIFLCRVALGS